MACAVAAGASTVVTTNGSPALRLLDGNHAITARQTIPGGPESDNSSPLIITVDTQSPTIQAWFSAATHQNGVGEAALPIPDDGSFSEPRDSGIAKLLVNFNEAIDPGTLQPASISLAGNDATGTPLDLSGIAIATSTRGGNVVGVISLSPQLPDFARYAVLIDNVKDVAGNTLVGDKDRIITALRGDVDGDLWVNVTDLSFIKGTYCNPVIATNIAQIRADIDQNGLVNEDDLSPAWIQRNHDARSISDPVFTSFGQLSLLPNTANQLSAYPLQSNLPEGIDQ